MNPAEDPLNDAEILFRQPGPPLRSSLDLEGMSGSTDRDGVTKRCPGLDRLAAIRAHASR